MLRLVVSIEADTPSHGSIFPCFALKQQGHEVVVVNNTCMVSGNTAGAGVVAEQFLVFVLEVVLFGSEGGKWQRGGKGKGFVHM